MGKKTTNKSGIGELRASPTPSPLRYPGGKSWLYPKLKKWIDSLEPKPKVVVEPFAGGANFGLLCLLHGKCSELVLCEKDARLAAFWRTVLSNSELLVNRILSFEAERDILEQVVGENYTSDLDIAFQTLLINRTSRAGVIAPGAGLLKRGENGRGVFSRWYPATLAKRIRDIAAVSNRISFIEGDALTLMQDRRAFTTDLWLIDPPYSLSETHAGHRLYTHTDLDHEKLMEMTAFLRGHFVLTYSDSRPICKLAQHHGLTVSRTTMRTAQNKNKRELVISRSKPLARTKEK